MSGYGIFTRCVWSHAQIPENHQQCDPGTNPNFMHLTKNPLTSVRWFWPTKIRHPNSVFWTRSSQVYSATKTFVVPLFAYNFSREWTTTPNIYPVSWKSSVNTRFAFNVHPFGFISCMFICSPQGICIMCYKCYHLWNSISGIFHLQEHKCIIV